MLLLDVSRPSQLSSANTSTYMSGNALVMLMYCRHVDEIVVTGCAESCVAYFSLVPIRLWMNTTEHKQLKFKWPIFDDYTKFSIWDDIKSLVQDCSHSIANALELLQSCAKPTVYSYHPRYMTQFDAEWFHSQVPLIHSMHVVIRFP